MKNGQQDVSAQPLVIVRRRRNASEEHHGGVWKIAYADFMTAMMAFFLVMWLINAADRKTIVQVAAYFNPIRLTDKTASTKGLQNQTDSDAKSEDQEVENKSAGSPDKENNEFRKIDNPDKSANSRATASSSQEALREQALFDDPSTSLNVLASKAKPKRMPRSAGMTENAPRDPFDPSTRRTEIPADIPKQDPTHKNLANSAEKKADSKAIVLPEKPQVVEDRKSKGEKDGAKPGDKAADKAGDKPDVKAGSAEKPSETQDNNESAQKPDKIINATQSPAEAEAAARAIETEIREAVAKVLDVGPKIQVVRTPEGVLISVLDETGFSMFEIGSAQPKPEVVLAIEKIGNVLRDKPGRILLRGHTDSRGYSGGHYDNWRLSAARAQISYYMLLRGGVSEDRFLAIEGRADRDLKVPTDGNAAENRRIDILVKDPVP